MGKNKSSNSKKKSQPIKKQNLEKSSFQVDSRRAFKAKKNKAFVKFKSKEKTAESIIRLNENLDLLRTNKSRFNKNEEKSDFVNPVLNEKRKSDQVTKDLIETIDKLSNL